MTQELGTPIVERVYAPTRRLVWGTWVFLSVVGVIYAVLLIALVGSVITGTGVAAADSSGRWVTAGIVLILVASYVVPYLLMTRVLLRPRMVVQDSGLVVINYFGSRTITWDDIAGFGLESSYYGISIHLRDDTVVITNAVQKSNLMTWLKRPARADAVVAELTADLRQHEQAGGRS